MSSPPPSRPSSTARADWSTIAAVARPVVGEPLDGLRDVRGQGELHDVAAVAGRGRPRPVGGQPQRLRYAGQFPALAAWA
ncbi:hypothetical protein STENM223S_00900 [Streptomyces tendae]